MRSNHLPAITILVLLSGCRDEPGVTGPTDPGFSEAYFDEEDLGTVMENGKAAYLHCYNVITEKGGEHGSVIAMGADKDHEELYAWLGGPWYRCFEALNGNEADCDRLAEDGAMSRVRYLRMAGLTSYAAVFEATDVKRQLDMDDCNGVKLVGERNDGYWTMRMFPVKIERDTAIVLGDTSNELVCTDPCPTYCGNTPSYFLNCR